MRWINDRKSKIFGQPAPSVVRPHFAVLGPAPPLLLRLLRLQPDYVLLLLLLHVLFLRLVVHAVVPLSVLLLPLHLRVVLLFSGRLQVHAQVMELLAGVEVGLLVLGGDELVGAPVF